MSSILFYFGWLVVFGIPLAIIGVCKVLDRSPPALRHLFVGMLITGAAVYGLQNGMFSLWGKPHGYLERPEARG